MARMFGKVTAGMLAAAMAVSPVTAMAAEKTHATMRVMVEAPESNENATMIQELLGGLVYDVYAQEEEGTVLENLDLTLNGAELLQVITEISESGSMKLAIPALDNNVYVLDLSGILGGVGGQLDAQGLDLSALPALPEISSDEYMAAFTPVASAVMEMIQSAMTMEETSVELPALGETIDAQVYTVTLNSESAAGICTALGEAMSGAEMNKIFEGWGQFVSELQPLVESGVMQLNGLAEGMDAQQLGGLIASAAPQLGSYLSANAEQIGAMVEQLGGELVVKVVGNDENGLAQIYAAVNVSGQELGSIDYEVLQTEDGQTVSVSVTYGGSEMGSITAYLAEDNGSIYVSAAGMNLGSLSWMADDESASCFVSVMDMIDLTLVATKVENGTSFYAAVDGLDYFTDGQISSVAYMVDEEEGFDQELTPLPAGNEIDVMTLAQDQDQLNELAQVWVQSLQQIMVNDPTISQILAAE